MSCDCHSGLVTNARRTGKGLLRSDPTRTLMIRESFMRDVKRRMRRIKASVKKFIDTDDVLGLKPRKGLVLHTQPRQYEFATNPEKLKAFNEWFRAQVEADVFSFTPTGGAGPTGVWTTGYITSAYKRGLLNAYLSTKAADPELFDSEGQMRMEDFLQSAFNAPETLEKVQLLATRAYEQFKGVTASMAADMNQILAEGLIDGSSALEIASNLTDRIDTLTSGRALTIARTEVIYAHAEGQLDSFERLGVKELGVKAEWLTAGDDRVCPLCAEKEGELFSIDDARGLIPLHPNCRCTWIPFIPVRA